MKHLIWHFWWSPEDKIYGLYIIATHLFNLALAQGSTCEQTIGQRRLCPNLDTILGMWNVLHHNNDNKRKGWQHLTRSLFSDLLTVWQSVPSMMLASHKQFQHWGLWCQDNRNLIHQGRIAILASEKAKPPWLFRQCHKIIGLGGTLEVFWTRHETLYHSN